jgi:hypothetical protein
MRCNGVLTAPERAMLALLGQDTQKLRDAAIADQVPDPLG